MNTCETCHGSGRDKFSRLARAAKVSEIEITKAAIRGLVAGIHEVNTSDGTFKCILCEGKGRTNFDLIEDENSRKESLTQAVECGKLQAP